MSSARVCETRCEVLKSCPDLAGRPVRLLAACRADTENIAPLQWMLSTLAGQTWWSGDHCTIHLLTHSGGNVWFGTANPISSGEMCRSDRVQWWQYRMLYRKCSGVD